MLSHSLLYYCFVFLLSLYVFLACAIVMDGYATRDGVEELMVVGRHLVLVGKRNERDSFSSLFVLLCFLSFFSLSKFVNTIFLLSVTRSPFYFYGSLMMAGGFCGQRGSESYKASFFFFLVDWFLMSD